MLIFGETAYNVINFYWAMMISKTEAELHGYYEYENNLMNFPINKMKVKSLY